MQTTVIFIINVIIAIIALILIFISLYDDKSNNIYQNKYFKFKYYYKLDYLQKLVKYQNKVIKKLKWKLIFKKERSE